VLVAVTTVAPLVALIWLGFRVLEQDRQLEREQLQDPLERAADLASAIIQQQLTAAEDRLMAAVGAADSALIDYPRTGIIGPCDTSRPRARGRYIGWVIQA